MTEENWIRASSSKEKGKEKAQDDGIFDWTTERTDTDDTNTSFALVGRLCSEKNINAKAAIETMCQLWRGRNKVEGNVIDPVSRTFLFKFADEKNKTRVLEGQPWLFNRVVWCFNDPNTDGRIADVALNMVPYWVRIYDLPINGRTNIENLRRMGDQVGRFVGVDYSANPELDSSVRVRILHNVILPLKKHVTIRMKNNNVTSFPIRYERLPMFCYGCGIMGHGERDCDEGPHEEDTYEFGDFLRASPWRPTKKETADERRSSRNLNRDFDKEYERDAEAEIDNMIKKLQEISIRFRRHPKEGERPKVNVEMGSNRGGGEEENSVGELNNMEEGSEACRRREARETMGVRAVVGLLGEVTTRDAQVAVPRGTFKRVLREGAPSAKEVEGGKGAAKRGRDDMERSSVGEVVGNGKKFRWSDDGMDTIMTVADSELHQDREQQ